MKLKSFLEDFKNEEILNIEYLELGDKESEYIDLLNKFFNREVEDRDVILDDLDKDNGFLYKLMCEWYDNEFVRENDLGLVWYEYSLEDFFRDSFRIVFELDDINRKLYGKDYEEE